MPYKDKEKQRNAMAEIVRNYRKRERERQTNIEQTIKKLDEKEWQRLYNQNCRRKKI